MKFRPDNRASVMVVAMIIMVLMTTLAVSFASITNMNAQKAEAARNGEIALMCAETGLQHMVAILRNTFVGDGTPEAIIDGVTDRIVTFLNGTANIDHRDAVVLESLVYVPPITLSDGQMYYIRVLFIDDGVRVYSTGRYNGIIRTVRLDMDCQVGLSPIFDFGVASKGCISVSGQAGIHGVNYPSEADILSATFSDPQAVTISGQTTIDGDVYTSNPDSFVKTLGGSISVGGDDGSLVDSHVHIGVGAVDFPEIDTSPYVPLATNTFDPAAGPVWENVRIPANTNPTFASDVELRGVIYIEQPNSVHFSSKVDLTGIIVTERATDPGSSLTFTGQVVSTGFENLPDEPQFAALKAMPGTMMLAPGFDVSFSGQSNMFNGALAAESFKFSGQAGGVIAGPIVAYGDTEFDLLGQCELYIDRSLYEGDPPGFTKTYWLTPVRGTYAQF